MWINTCLRNQFALLSAKTYLKNRSNHYTKCFMFSTRFFSSFSYFFVFFWFYFLLSQSFRSCQLQQWIALTFTNKLFRSLIVSFNTSSAFVVSKRNWKETRNKLLEYSVTKHLQKRSIAYTLCWMQCTHQQSHVRKYRCVNRCCADSINMTKLLVSSYNRFDVARIQRLHKNSNVCINDFITFKSSSLRFFTL